MIGLSDMPEQCPFPTRNYFRKQHNVKVACKPVLILNQSWKSPQMTGRRWKGHRTPWLSPWKALNNNTYMCVWKREREREGKCKCFSCIYCSIIGNELTLIHNTGRLSAFSHWTEGVRNTHPHAHSQTGISTSHGCNWLAVVLSLGWLLILTKFMVGIWYRSLSVIALVYTSVWGIF